MLLIPIKVKRKNKKFDLKSELSSVLKTNKVKLKKGDILVISSKYVSIADGRLINLKEVTISEEAKKIGKKYSINTALAEVITNEAEKVLAGQRGFVMSIKNKVITPNSGVDTSNIPKNYAVVYPENPNERAMEIKNVIKKEHRIDSGVIITDSRIAPTRIGTTGIAIGVAGLKPVIDERGKKDLFGKSIKRTKKALADNLSSAAQILMGESDERIPIVIIRDSKIRILDHKSSESELSIDYKKCVYVKRLKNN